MSKKTHKEPQVARRALPNAGKGTGNGEPIDKQAIEDADDLRASKEALAEGGVRPFSELLAELGLE